MNTTTTTTTTKVYGQMKAAKTNECANFLRLLCFLKSQAAAKNERSANKEQWIVQRKEESKYRV